MAMIGATIPELKADCGRCKALCCVALAFDAGPSFAFAKAAGRACRNLAGDNTCRIHDGLAASGMGGCAAYDCLGAGQYVSERLFAGRSWQSEPELLTPMMAAFSLTRRIHSEIELLEIAEKTLTLTAADESRRQALLSRLAPDGGWTETALNGPAAVSACEAARRFLRSLATGPLRRIPEAEEQSSDEARR
jgi:hypothetical protein